MIKQRKGLSPEAKQQRIEYHIKERLEFSPENIYFVAGFDWRYIPVHPVADETWWFEKFKESPEICTGADFYWQFEGDVAFLEISTRKERDFEKEEFLARWRGGTKDGLLNLHARVEDELIYSYTVERVMKTFWDFHQQNDLFETFYLKKELRELC